jgi:hypothetical protein
MPHTGQFGDDTPTTTESVATARALVNCDEATLREAVDQLRRSVRLSRTVRGLNRLLDQPDFRPLSRAALKSIGLEHSG